MEDYPKNINNDEIEASEKVTGYNYEPWHFRYIGERSVAEKITKEGLTFEEYLSNK